MGGVDPGQPFDRRKPQPAIRCATGRRLRTLGALAAGQTIGFFINPHGHRIGSLAVGPLVQLILGQTHNPTAGAEPQITLVVSNQISDTVAQHFLALGEGAPWRW